MILFTCANCGKSLNASEEKAGRTARCPSCRGTVTIPAAKTNPKEVGEAIYGKRPLLGEVARLMREKPNVSPFGQPTLTGQRSTVPSQPSYARKASQASPPAGRGGRKWVFLLIPLVVLVIGGGVAWRFNLLSYAGISFGETDIRKVSVNPEAYAGQTLTSVVMAGFGAYEGIGGGKPLMLYVPIPIREKALNVENAVGSYCPIMIKYRIHDRATFARIKSYQEVEEAAQKAKEELRDHVIQAAGGGDKAEEERLQNQLQEEAQKEKERRVSTLGDVDEAYPGSSGVLLDAWIP